MDGWRAHSPAKAQDMACDRASPAARKADALVAVHAGRRVVSTVHRRPWPANHSLGLRRARLQGAWAVERFRGSTRGPGTASLTAVRAERPVAEIHAAKAWVATG